jgi:hypothetical protein
MLCGFSLAFVSAATLLTVFLPCSIALISSFGAVLKTSFAVATLRGLTSSSLRPVCAFYQDANLHLALLDYRRAASFQSSLQS